MGYHGLKQPSIALDLKSPITTTSVNEIPDNIGMHDYAATDSGSEAG